LIPFINWGRKEYDGNDVESGAPMGDEHTAVSWCDGDNAQIDTIVSEEGIQRYSANNIIANKHNASSTEKEQANCLCKVFPISNQLNKTTTVEHISSSNHHLKRHLEEQEQFAKFNSSCISRSNLPSLIFLPSNLLSCHVHVSVRTSCLDM